MQPAGGPSPGRWAIPPAVVERPRLDRRRRHGHPAAGSWPHRGCVDQLPDLSGEWVETGDEVLLTTFGVRGDSPNVASDGTTTCDEAVIEQDQVLSVLGDGFRAEVDGQHLTLTSRDGLGLTYRAAED